MLILPELTQSTCSIPVHPEGEIYGTVGTVTAEGKTLLCGGHQNKSVLNSCRLLDTGTWSEAQPMSTAREDAAASRLGGWRVDGYWRD